METQLGYLGSPDQFLLGLHHVCILSFPRLNHRRLQGSAVAESQCPWLMQARLWMCVERGGGVEVRTWKCGCGKVGVVEKLILWVRRLKVNAITAKEDIQLKYEKNKKTTVNQQPQQHTMTTRPTTHDDNNTNNYISRQQHQQLHITTTTPTTTYHDNNTSRQQHITTTHHNNTPRQQHITTTTHHDNNTPRQQRTTTTTHHDNNTPRQQDHLVDGVEVDSGILF